MVDPDRFEELYRRYYARLFAYCLATVGRDEDAAAEAVDEAFLTLYRKWDSLEVDDGVVIWLYRTANNKAMKIHNKKTRFFKKTDLVGDTEDVDRFASLAGNDVYFRGDIPEKDGLGAVTRSLPEEYRDLFNERFVKKKTLTELSESTGMAYSTLRRRIAKLDLLVRKIVAEMFVDSDVQSSL